MIAFGTASPNARRLSRRSESIRADFHPAPGDRNGRRFYQSASTDQTNCRQQRASIHCPSFKNRKSIAVVSLTVSSGDFFLRLGRQSCRAAGDCPWTYRQQLLQRRRAPGSRFRRLSSCDGSCQPIENWRKNWLSSNVKLVPMTSKSRLCSMPFANDLNGAQWLNDLSAKGRISPKLFG
jgi:hypothetical protein